MDPEELLGLYSDISTMEEARDETVERAKVGKILESGRVAPSPGNLQSKEFIVVENKFKKNKMAEVVGDKRLRDSPTVILILTDDQRMKRRTGSSFDRFAESEAACAVQNMRTMALGQGLSTVWLDGFDSEPLRSLFDIPDTHTVRSILILGYPQRESEIEPRFSLNETAYYDEYGSQIASQFDQLHWRGLRTESRIGEKKADTLVGRLRRFIRNRI